MKNLLSILMAIGLLFAGGLYAQEEAPAERGEIKIKEPDGTNPANAKQQKIDQLRVAFITKEVKLTVQQNKDFWPIYNARQNEINNLRNEQRALLKDLKDKDKDLTPQEKTALMDRIAEIDKKVAMVEFDFYGKFKKILPIEKVIKLYKAEQDFKKELLERYGKDKPGANPTKSAGKSTPNTKTGNGNTQPKTNKYGNSLGQHPKDPNMGPSAEEALENEDQQ